MQRRVGYRKRPIILLSDANSRYCTPVVISYRRTDREDRMNRVEMLSEILAQNPNDAFARYGLALEYSNQGQIETAMAEFAKLLSAHPDYTAGYFMAAQTLAKADRIEEAKRMLSDGIASARRTGNSHAQAEMSGMLAELTGG